MEFNSWVEYNIKPNFDLPCEFDHVPYSWVQNRDSALDRNLWRQKGNTTFAESSSGGKLSYWWHRFERLNRNLRPLPATLSRSHAHAPVALLPLSISFRLTLSLPAIPSRQNSINSSNWLIPKFPSALENPSRGLCNECLRLPWAAAWGCTSHSCSTGAAILPGSYKRTVPDMALLQEQPMIRSRVPAKLEKTWKLSADKKEKPLPS